MMMPITMATSMLTAGGNFIFMGPPSLADCQIIRKIPRAQSAPTRTGCVHELLMTRRACLVPEANALESAFVKAPQNTASHRVAGETLEVRDAAGAVRMRLGPAHCAEAAKSGPQFPLVVPSGRRQYGCPAVDIVLW
jgi:hypothetical protein